VPCVYSTPWQATGSGLILTHQPRTTGTRKVAGMFCSHRIQGHWGRPAMTWSFSAWYLWHCPCVTCLPCNQLIYCSLSSEYLLCLKQFCGLNDNQRPQICHCGLKWRCKYALTSLYMNNNTLNIKICIHILKYIIKILLRSNIGTESFRAYCLQHWHKRMQLNNLTPFLLTL
jgi:hypothetical protein